MSCRLMVVSDSWRDIMTVIFCATVMWSRLNAITTILNCCKRLGAVFKCSSGRHKQVSSTANVRCLFVNMYTFMLMFGIGMLPGKHSLMLPGDIFEHNSKASMVSCPKYRTLRFLSNTVVKWKEYAIDTALIGWLSHVFSQTSAALPPRVARISRT